MYNGIGLPKSTLINYNLEGIQCQHQPINRFWWWQMMKTLIVNGDLLEEAQTVGQNLTEI
jgi:hypothetical protein